MVDVTMIVHAGIGEEATGVEGPDDPDAIWSHRWDLGSAGIAAASLPQSDGVMFLAQLAHRGSEFASFWSF